MPIPSESWNSILDGTYPSAFQNRFRSLGDAIYDYYPNVNAKLLKDAFDNSGKFRDIYTAAEAFVAWYYHNLLGGTSQSPFKGYDWDNPYEYNFTRVQRCRMLRVFGCRDNDDDMCESWNGEKGGALGGDVDLQQTNQTFVSANTIFQISQCDVDLKQQQAPFVWDSNGGFCLYDRYNFDSEEDFKLGSGGLFAILGSFAKPIGCGIAALNNSPLGEWRDAWFNYIGLSPKPDREPYLTWKDPEGVIKKGCPGKSRYLYTKVCFPPEEVRDCNPELYFDRLSKGLISYSSVPGALAVGDKQPSPFLGLPFQPPVSVDIEPSSNYFGFNYGDYSAPFNSWSQGVTNATFDLGPYAKIEKFYLKFPTTTCLATEDAINGEKGGFPDDGNALYGRIIYITSGVGAGELGFILQDWYHFNDEPYNTVDGTASGERYPSKAEWWESAIKSPMTVRFMHLSSRPEVKVEVAASGPLLISGSPDSNYYPGQNLSGVNDLSRTILQTMTATAALTRWI